MSDNPVISSLLTVPTLAANGRSQLTVGVQLNNGQRFWADCVDVPAASRSEETAVFDPIQAAKQVQNLVQPLWQDQSPAAFRPLAQLLLPIQESFQYERTTSPQPQSATGAISRRTLITGFLAEEEAAAPQFETITITRPLHRALQYGLTAALLQAAANVNQVTVVELVAREYGLRLPETAVPLQIPLNDQNVQTAHAILTSHVTSLGYTTSKNNHKAALGEDGSRLQQHVRQVATWLSSVAANYRPSLHLDVQGGYSDLFENNNGKILGAIVGLEQAARPYPLQLQNPVWLETHDAQIEHLTQLSRFINMRHLPVQLVADAWVDSLAAAEQFADPQICQMVHVALPRLGNLEEGITAVLHLLSHNQQVILSGEETSLTTQIALATQPHQLSGIARLHYNIMQQFVQPSSLI